MHAVGEMMLDVGAPHGWGPKRLTAEQLQLVLERLTAAAQEGSADVTVLRQGTTEVPGEGEEPACFFVVLRASAVHEHANAVGV